MKPVENQPKLLQKQGIHHSLQRQYPDKNQVWFPALPEEGGLEGTEALRKGEHFENQLMRLHGVVEERPAAETSKPGPYRDLFRDASAMTGAKHPKTQNPIRAYVVAQVMPTFVGLAGADVLGKSFEEISESVLIRYTVHAVTTKSTEAT